jgi:hypothetical protein
MNIRIMVMLKQVQCGMPLCRNATPYETKTVNNSSSRNLQDVGTLQGLMKNYIAFTKKHQQMVPMRLGCDDEKPSNLLELLHQLKEDYGTGMQETQQRRTS